MTTREVSPRESARKWVHIASLGFALLLRWLTPLQAVGFGVGALGFNVFVLPHLGRALFRRNEKPGSLFGGGGIIIYPVAVLLLVTIIGAGLGRMDIAAGAWAAEGHGRSARIVRDRYVPDARRQRGRADRLWQIEKRR